MWILAKHPSTVDGSSGNPQFYLLGGRKYVIGRKDCDIVITGDISISRRHATISVSKVDPADHKQPVEGITILDTSKVGVQINGSKIAPKADTSLKDGDFISFGCLNMKYKLIHQRLVVVTSCVNTSSSKAALKLCIPKLGGFICQHWNGNTTHLVMEKVTFTMKVLCAIACGKPVVTVKYLEDLLDCYDKKTSLNLPHEKEYLPPITEQTLLHQEHLFHPNSTRNSLMIGKLFVILVPQQFKRIKDAIQFAGGEAILKDTKDGKFVKHISSSQTIVMQVEKKDEKSTNAEQMNWIREVYAKLTLQKLRAIRESEIGLAILNMSLDKYCNPTLNAAPAINGGSHTQVIADSISATQQTQLLVNNATQSLGNMEQSQIHHSVCILPNESFDIASTEKLPTTKVVDKDAVINTISKRKRPIGSSTDISDGQKRLHDFFKKPKLNYVNNTENTYNVEKMNTDIRNIDNDDDACELKTSKTKKVCKPKKLHQNIINIENDDDEDDIFSFNLPKAEKAFDEDLKYMETDLCTNQNSDTIPIILNKLSATVSKNIKQTQQPNPESAVLFTPLSEKTVPDSCLLQDTPLSRKTIPDTALPCAITPFSKRNVIDTTLDNNCIPESCPTFEQRKISVKPVESSHDFNRKLYDDDDDDYDPFSFSIDTKSSGKNAKKEITKTVDDITDNIENRYNDNLLKNDEVVSDSGTNLNKSVTDHEKQKSRFLKALSSSQWSGSENVLVSDEEEHLIPKEKIQKNEVDLSYLLDDVDDLEVVSKEYSLHKPKNHILLEGFISTLDLRPNLNIINEEDPDLIGIGTNLIQTSFVSLVVKEPQKNMPRKTSNVPGSKLKNFKTFKKQYYAGRSRKTKWISKDDLVVYESDNIERASLFSEIREKDEEEAAENRRIDKMFDAMPQKRKTTERR